MNGLIKKLKAVKYLHIVIGILALITTSCYDSETLNVPVKETDVDNMSDLDIYIRENFVDKYNMAIRYRFVDRHVNPGERVTPPKLSNVRPMLDFIEEFWIDPYLEVENGEAFFRKNVPVEIILLGGFIYNPDGTVTLGTADAGARITFTNVNAIDLTDIAWRDLQLQTVYHEFAHIVHQESDLPAAFEDITPTGYTSAGSWFTITETEALQRGFVSNYATSSPNEDFAETVAFYLFHKDFDEDFITPESNCQDEDCISRNKGKASISTKLQAISDHYEKVTGINLLELREVIQSKLQ